jgi:hypothetical protein
MADVALITSQGLDQFDMPHGGSTPGAVMFRQQQPHDPLLQSGQSLRCHRFPPQAPLQWTSSIASNHP